MFFSLSVSAKPYTLFCAERIVDFRSARNICKQASQNTNSKRIILARIISKRNRTPKYILFWLKKYQILVKKCQVDFFFKNSVSHDFLEDCDSKAPFLCLMLYNLLYCYLLKAMAIKAKYKCHFKSFMLRGLFLVSEDEQLILSIC